MRVALFYHSLISDWNHGNAHFLRGIATELVARGHDVRIFEPRNGWSLASLVADHGRQPIRAFQAAYPQVQSEFYDPESLDLDGALEGADLAIVHEWNDPEFVRRIGRHRQESGGYRLYFHDTHHRIVTEPDKLAACGIDAFDAVLAYGRVIRDAYLERGWTERAFVWHEAADTRVFRPLPGPLEGDLVWVGNWGDNERAAEIREFLVEPVRALGLRAHVYGVRYPRAALAELDAAGIEYRGWLPNYRVPEVFGRFRFTVHIPRGPYVSALPGIPTIRVFEALACAIPLISAPWQDTEKLFTPGRDFLFARDGSEMTRIAGDLVRDGGAARHTALRGRLTVLARHTCAHRVDELLRIDCVVRGGQEEEAAA